MALIRHAQARSLARDALVLDLGDLKRQADELKASAEQEAERIIRDAHEERSRILEGSSEEGYSAGRAVGLEDGLKEGRAAGRTEAFDQYRERLERVATAFEASLDRFENAREELMLNAQEDGLRLVLEIARRVTLRAAAIDHDSLGDRIRESLIRVLDPSRLVIRIHPDDTQLVGEIVPQVLSRLSESSDAEILEDANLSPGDVVISSGRGWIDTSIGAQLERVIGELMPGFHSDPLPSPLSTDAPETPSMEPRAEEGTDGGSPDDRSTTESEGSPE